MADTAARAAVPVWAAGLDPVQLGAAEHDGGPLLIVAGAGTGKTRTLVARLARLIDRGVPPERILLVTFSRRAADEMVRRLAPLVGAAAARQVRAGTFHAVAHRFLRQHGASLGLGEGFSVMDKGDAVDLLELVRQEVMSEDDGPGPEERRRRWPRKDTLGSIYTRVVNSQVPLSEVLVRHFPWVRDHEQAIGLVFSAYTARKRARRLLDFDDLLLYWRAAASDPALGTVLAQGYDHVLVDEYQDTNLLQADIVVSLAAAGCAVTAVGDDAQAIYAFRAASGRNMIDFPARFPGATIITLERNYRSTQPILDLANFVLAGASEGYDKRLWTATTGGGRPSLATCPDEGAQSEAVADLILDHHEAGTPLRQQAVLFRSAHHSDLLELELHRRGIPFVKYGGLRFLEAAHVRDLVALLRVLDNAHDELAWYRILQLLEGVGPVRARRIMSDLGLPMVVDAARTTPGPASSVLPASPVSPAPPAWPVSPASAAAADNPLGRFIAGRWAVPPKAAEDASALVGALQDCFSGGLSPAGQIERLRQALDPVLQRRYDDAEVRLRDFEALARVASGSHDRAGLVADLTLDPPSSTGDLAGPPLLDDDYVTLSTVHSAKGGEWRVVHLIHAADGMFPSDLATGCQEDIEEERRLFYVALTRAQHTLHIYAPLRYHHSRPFGRGDAHSYAQRTRFLPPAANGLLEHRPVRTRPADSGPAVVIADLTSSVETSLRSLW